MKWNERLFSSCQPSSDNCHHLIRKMLSSDKRPHPIRCICHSSTSSSSSLSWWPDNPAHPKRLLRHCRLFEYSLSARPCLLFPLFQPQFSSPLYHCWCQNFLGVHTEALIWSPSRLEESQKCRLSRPESFIVESSLQKYQFPLTPLTFDMGSWERRASQREQVIQKLSTPTWFAKKSIFFCSLIHWQAKLQGTR